MELTLADVHLHSETTILQLQTSFLREIGNGFEVSCVCDERTFKLAMPLKMTSDLSFTSSIKRLATSTP